MKAQNGGPGQEERPQASQAINEIMFLGRAWPLLHLTPERLAEITNPGRVVRPPEPPEPMQFS